MNTIEEKREFAREELLAYFAEALNEARRHLTSPGTRDLEVEKWEPLFCCVEEKILVHIREKDINNLPKLKKYFEELSIEWGNGAWRSAWQEVLNYKKQ